MTLATRVLCGAVPFLCSNRAVSTVIGTWALANATPFTLENVAFQVASGGAHTLEFLATSAGDHTAFVPDVSINSVPEPGSFALLPGGLSCAYGLYRKVRHSR
jgi:hypothetical protein